MLNPQKKIGKPQENPQYLINLSGHLELCEWLLFLAHSHIGDDMDYDYNIISDHNTFT